MHHDVERSCVLILDIVQGVDVALIYIKEGICRELHRLMGPSAPLIKHGIQLCDNYLALFKALLQNNLIYLLPLPPRPTLGSGPRTLRHHYSLGGWGTVCMIISVAAHSHIPKAKG